MADLVIRGMAMPENCGNCFFCDDWAKCQLLNLNNIFDYCKDGIERPAKCPIVPLPEGHGRLGDLDELETTVIDAIEKGFNAEDVLLDIHFAPTIVPAEGGGKDA